MYCWTIQLQLQIERWTETCIIFHSKKVDFDISSSREENWPVLSCVRLLKMSRMISCWLCCNHKRVNITTPDTLNLLQDTMTGKMFCVEHFISDKEGWGQYSRSFLEIFGAEDITVNNKDVALCLGTVF